MDKVVTTTHTLTLKLMKGRMRSAVICMKTLQKFLQRDRAVGYAGNSLQIRTVEFDGNINYSQYTIFMPRRSNQLNVTKEKIHNDIS